MTIPPPEESRPPYLDSRRVGLRALQSNTATSEVSRSILRRSSTSISGPWSRPGRSEQPAVRDGSPRQKSSRPVDRRIDSEIPTTSAPPLVAPDPSTVSAQVSVAVRARTFFSTVDSRIVTEASAVNGAAENPTGASTATDRPMPSDVDASSRNRECDSDDTTAGRSRRVRCTRRNRP